MDDAVAVAVAAVAEAVAVAVGLEDGGSGAHVGCALQGAQSVASTEPEYALTAPAAQRVHVAWPTRAAYESGGHGSGGAAPPAHEDPAGQGSPCHSFEPGAQ